MSCNSACVSYEAYLYSQVTKKDLYYLEDIELASQLVELGWSLLKWVGMNV